MEKLEWRTVQPINKRANLPSSRWGHACCCIND